MDIPQNEHLDNSFDAPQSSPQESLRPNFFELSRHEQCAAVEALLFASEEPLSAQNLYDLLVVGEELEKKSLSKHGANGKNGHAKNGKLNGHSQNGTAHEATPKVSNDHVSSENAHEFHQELNRELDQEIQPEFHHEHFDDVTLHVAHLHVEPPEGFADEALGMSDDALLKPTEAETFIGGLIQELNADFEATARVFRIVEVAREGMKGFQFATKPEFGELLARLVKSKSKKRLSKAALETLAIIAYRQPVSKPELEVIRGVSSNEIINRLLEKNLITIVGRSEAVGKPLLYGTTDDFLRLFGLHSLSDLPKPRELEELMAERADILEVAQAINQAEANVEVNAETSAEASNEAEDTVV
jgi:segregation and condensation protein B